MDADAIGAALVSLSKSNVGTCIGLICTVLGFVVGAVALVLTILIYRWTNQDDANRHAELLDAVKTMGATVEDLGKTSPLSPADLTKLSPAERSALHGLLQPDEIVVRVERSGTGRGNHPWQAVTSAGRLLQVYTGGRRGGVHATEVS